MSEAVGSRRQFLGFVLTGGFAAGVNFCSRILFNQWLSFSTAVIAAYLLGMVVAFVLARGLVYGKGSQSLYRSAFWFALVNVVAVLQTWLISMCLVTYAFPQFGVAWHPRELAHALGVAVPVFSSYFGHKHLSFRHE